MRLFVACWLFKAKIVTRRYHLLLDWCPGYTCEEMQDSQSA